jgi:hypothetical protein
MKRNAHRVLAALPVALLALAATAPARAALVTYQASGLISEADNAAQLPSVLSSAAVGGELTVDFTVDTKAAGVSNGPGDMSYAYPLLSQHASIGAGSFGLGVDISQIEITHNALSGGLYGSGYELLSFANVPTDFTGIASSFALVTQSSSVGKQSLYKDTSLTNAPLQASKANFLDGMLLEFTSYIDGVAQSTSDVFVNANVAISKVDAGHITAPEIDPASMTSALTLLIGGLVVLTSRRSLKV